MENKYYKFKNILLGLRGEYQNSVRNLNELKDYVIIKDKTIDDIEFIYPSIMDDEKVKLVCLVKYIENIEGKRSYIIVRYNVCRTILNKYEIENLDGFLIENDDLFSDKVSVIVDSPFYNFIKNTRLINQSRNDIIYNLQIDSYGLHLSLCKGDYIVSLIKYDARKDEVKIDIYDNLELEKKGKSIVNEALNVKIPDSEISAFLKSVIISNKDSDKRIDCKDKEYVDKSQSYMIEEESKGLVLTRK